MLRPRGSVVGALLVLCGGCAGSLENPDAFGDGGSKPTAFVCASLGVPVKAQLVAQKCATSGCHTAASPAGNLDLVSPNVASRLVDVATAACPPRVRVSRTDGGTLQELISITPSTCGPAVMPLGAQPLSPAEVACIVEWTRNLVDGGVE